MVSYINMIKKASKLSGKELWIYWGSNIPNSNIPAGKRLAKVWNSKKNRALQQKIIQNMVAAVKSLHNLPKKEKVDIFHSWIAEAKRVREQKKISKQ